MKENELIMYITLAMIICCMFVTIYLSTALIDITFKYVDKYFKKKIKINKFKKKFIANMNELPIMQSAPTNYKIKINSNLNNSKNDKVKFNETND